MTKLRKSTMRLFVSINLPPEVKNKLTIIQQELIENIFGVKNLVVKWEKKENFHITIFFLGEVQNSKIKEIIFPLENIKLDKKDSQIVGKGINAFPHIRTPRVFFVDLIDKSNLLLDLYKEVCKSLQPIGFIPDKKFHNHITLGRVKTYVKIPEDINLNRIDCSFQFKPEKFNLMQSTLTPEGSIYTTIKEFYFS